MSWINETPILVPFDFSEDSVDAFHKALELVDDPSGVQVIHVLGELSPGEPGEVWNTVDEKSRSEHATKAIHEILPEELSQSLSVFIAFGDAGYEIVDHAEKINAKLIVMPSQGRSGLMRVLLGSVADRVSRLAKCPVLILRGHKK